MADGKLSKTYRETCEEFLAHLKETSEHPELIADPTFAFLFAEYLDSFPSLNPQLELMVMQKVIEVDREYTQALIDELGIPRATKVARAITARHKGKYDGTKAGAAARKLFAFSKPEEEKTQLDVHAEIDAAVAGGAPDAPCGNCSHPKYLHEENEVVQDVHCSAYAEAAVADCDCPGFIPSNETSAPLSDGGTGAV